MSDEVEVSEMSKEQAEAKLDELMGQREDIVWQLVDIQLSTADLMEHLDTFEEKQ